MPGFATLVNAAAVATGAFLGLFAGRLVPERVRACAMGALGLAIAFLGLQMALDPQPYGLDQDQGQPGRPNHLAIVGGLVAGSLVGEGLQIETRMERFARRIQAWAFASPTNPQPESPGTGKQGSTLADGFVDASLLYCVGAMAVIGPIQDAGGQPQILYVKAMVDGLSAVMLASVRGGGVGFSAVSILLYQGAITFAAAQMTTFLTASVLATLTAAGGLLIAAIGLDLAGFKRLSVGNMLPGIFLAALLAWLSGR